MTQSKNQLNLMKKIGATPAKLVVVGVLGVVLLAVVVPQLLGSQQHGPQQHSKSPEVPTNDSLSKTALKPQPHGNAPSENTSGPALSKTENRPAPVWPQIPMEQILSYDPLAAPPWFIAAMSQPKENIKTARNEDNLEVLEELEQQGASIVVITSQARVARIGDLQIRIGDRIEGFHVSDITTKGVVLTEISSN